MTCKKLAVRGFLALCMISLILASDALSTPSAADGVPLSAHTVVWSEPKDPYQELAREIASAEGLLLVDTVGRALAYDPEFLIWVVSPGWVSEETFSDLGRALRRHGKVVSLGLISGSTIDMARDLWQRRPGHPVRQLSIVPREEHMEVSVGGQITHHSLTIEEAVAQIERADYVMFDGHGSRRYWRLNDTTELVASDLPSLPPQIVAAGACQTFKIWSEGSIALAFVDQGAAAYVGFLHSPHGYLMGDPRGFPFQHTWPDFPLGHAVQVQNRGLQQGFIAWPYYLLLGDPRLALQSGPPYRVGADDTVGDVRVLTFTAAQKGVTPVHVPGGAAYSFVEIPGEGRAWQQDRFYNGEIQMADIGADKYLLFRLQGGEFTLHLYPEPPWYWPALRVVGDAFDHTTSIHHAPGSVALGWISSGALFLVVVWMYSRQKPPLARSLLPSIAAGLLLVALRGGYVLVRRPYLASLYDQWLRTMDVAFDISVPFLISTFLTVACGTWLFLNARSRWARRGAFLATLAFPNCVVAAFWFGSVTLINALASERIGLPLYGYGGGLMPLIVCGIEGGLIALMLWPSRRWAQSSFV